MASFVSVVSAPAASTISSGSSCKNAKKTVISNSTKYKCKKIGKKLIWKKVSYSPKIKVSAPGVKPTISAYYARERISGTIEIPSMNFLQNNNIKSAIISVYARNTRGYSKIGELDYDFLGWNENLSKSLDFSWNIKRQYAGYEFAVEANFFNEGGQSPTVFLPVVLLETKPTEPTSPLPTTSPLPEVGCSVNYISSLPYSSQRIAITSISWEKDVNGYVSAIVSLRNDNTMNLRLVEFAFFAIHKSVVVRFDQTLQKNSFFIKDDASFNSIEGKSGSWMSGQTRTFKLPSNQILECRSISVFASGFSVTQGIGE